MDEFKEYFSKQYNIMQNKTKKGREFLFEGDEKLKEYSKDSKSSTELHLNLLPQPFIGDLKNAKIIICSLNPGYSEEDKCIEKKYQKDLLKQLDPDEQNKTLFWLTGDENDGGGFKWWQSKLNQKSPNKNINLSFVQEIIDRYKKNGITVYEKDVFIMLSNIMAAVELFPYHSKSFKYRLLNDCKSTERIRNYVHDVLIEESKKGKKLVCFTRSFKQWGKGGKSVKELASGVDNIICASNPRCVTFNVTLPFGEAIIDYLDKKITGGFTKKI